MTFYVITIVLTEGGHRDTQSTLAGCIVQPCS